MDVRATTGWRSGLGLAALPLALAAIGCEVVSGLAGVEFAADGSGGTGGACPAGLTMCGATCVDTAVDPVHCGGCNKPCESGFVCAEGDCRVVCTGGTTLCGDACTDTSLDRKNCGSCGTQCGSGEVCSAGQCAVDCLGGTTKCEDKCVDTALDPANCGSCGNACVPGEVCSASKCALECHGGMTECGNKCVDTLLDPANCGGCDQACVEGEVCAGSKCALECDGGVKCGPKCVDTQTDGANCGGCGNACKNGEVCSAGQCALQCVGGTVKCGNVCTNTKFDPANCGGCGNDCTPGEICAAGKCALACTAGTTKCGSKCVDTLLDPANCGGCSKACAPGEICSAASCGLVCAGGMTKCGNKCVDTQLDLANCGGCGKSCGPGEVCSQGQCGLVCQGGTTKCAGKCVDTQLDLAHCGGCGKPCGPGELCSAGQCGLVCQGGTTKCAGKCVNTGTDPAHCGGCDQPCPQGQGCSGGVCTCQGGTTKCGNDCVLLASDPKNCGFCGKACAPGEACSAGTCTPVCQGGTTKCGNKCVLLASDPENCGACGNACAPSEGCSGAACVCQGGTTKCGNDCVLLASDAKNCGACGVVCSDPCNAGQCCGDGKKNGAEQCDKNDLGNKDCAGVLGPTWTGSLACSPSCKLDTGGCKDSTVYNSVTDKAKWSTYNVATVDVNVLAKGFVGGVFDGRYVYLVPYFNGAYHGQVARHDTQGDFSNKGSWQVFNAASVNGDARGFFGGVFDGRYIYFVPMFGSNYSGLVTRYDTQAAFAQNGSWATYDVTAVQSSAKGFLGGVFDGRYVYLVPRQNATNSFHGFVARYDTQGGFIEKGSWAIFDTVSVDGGAKGFAGGVFDGRYVYLVPYENSKSIYDGIVVRYDTQAAFDQKGSWATYDTSKVNPNARGFVGAAFDGRYVYLVPFQNGASSYHGIVARYDTQAAFDQKGSWATYDTSKVNLNARGFEGAAFDGRYVYLVPASNANATPHGIIARYDTQAAFDQQGSWAVFDINKDVQAGAKGFIGGVFDGRYLYLVPFTNGAYHGIVARFDAKTPPSMPKGYSGSFL
ncbi:MAG: hypothetical protein HY744_00315 [Deltaproteobacteria bacterium]|nr:hypothetical protein [Deltaproteobacteria bacterium]